MLFLYGNHYLDTKTVLILYSGSDRLKKYWTHSILISWWRLSGQTMLVCLTLQLISAGSAFIWSEINKSPSMIPCMILECRLLTSVVDNMSQPSDDTVLIVQHKSIGNSGASLVKKPPSCTLPLIWHHLLFLIQIMTSQHVIKWHILTDTALIFKIIHLFFFLHIYASILLERQIFTDKWKVLI